MVVSTLSRALEVAPYPRSYEAPSWRRRRFRLSGFSVSQSDAENRTVRLVTRTALEVNALVRVVTRDRNRMKFAMAAKVNEDRLPLLKKPVSCSAIYRSLLSIEYNGYSTRVLLHGGYLY
jgi:hypothetical protein